MHTNNVSLTLAQDADSREAASVKPEALLGWPKLLQYTTADVPELKEQRSLPGDHQSNERSTTGYQIDSRPLHRRDRQLEPRPYRR